MPMEKKSESKVLDRTYIELALDDRAGRINRKEAIAMVAQEMGVQPENVGLIRMEGQSGTTRVLGRFYVYGSMASKKRVHLKHLGERTLTKEEREKLRQERRKAKTPAAAAEAK